VLKETLRYKEESDAVGRFIADECLVGGAQSSETTAKLYDRWQIWAARESGPELSKIAFGRTLDRKGFPVDQNTKGWRRRGIYLRKDGQVN
jgi:putative DNA primase/helicase